MLYSIDSDKPIIDIPKRHKKSFNLWRRNLSNGNYDIVIESIRKYIDAVPKDKPFVSSYIPGPDWTNTPYQPLYIACNRNQEHSGWFFGLIVWQVIIDHPDNWLFKPSDKDDDILGTTYWRKL
jgi:hypothetical protein